ncbi:exocellobiohydrolase [Anaeromyces robustus]|jgi:cellulose 1,4-beta-cellobiosidase|uniref:Glucanase n=1 Tax=Anaeromyces robustus TaxID=1754192 RepID=A0A1Y1XC40_9FUNG|nr:exocellobiohydrolase [Anaeromyces robustus]|eukprot:ORX82996.1 exocellobiohydrolase [Anaeromyces robustus]
MKFVNLLSSTLFALGALASSCHPNYPCCNGCEVVYTDVDGEWGVENGAWCLLQPSKCYDTCNTESLGYPCCTHCNTIYTDADGDWGIENGDWCGINNSCNGGGQRPPQNPTPIRTTTTTTTTKKTYPTVNPSFFSGNIYSNYQYQSEVQSSINKLSGNLQQQANRVKYVPTAVWLAWDGAPKEVQRHLSSANGSTAVFIMYWIPTRDCNSNASQGGANDLNAYKSYVDDVANTFRSNQGSRIVIVVEPDTIGNMVTSQNNENCRRTAVIHKQALAYAVNRFGSLNNVQVYLDAGHSQWLTGYEDETAAVIKEILDMANQGKIRGFSTNVSNFQPIDKEYEYQTRLYDALENVGITDMRFVIDTSRNGQDISEAFAKTKTWCNLVGTGFGERPKGNPDPINMPLLDAYMWLKPPAESDGSSQGMRADPVCARSDSLPNAPEAGSWFHDYFVQLLRNANPPF